MNQTAGGVADLEEEPVTAWAGCVNSSPMSHLPDWSIKSK